MPVTANKLSTVLQIKVNEGTDDQGNDLIATKSYRNIKVTAEDQNMYDLSQVIGSLMSTPVVSVIRADSAELINEA